MSINKKFKNAKTITNIPSHPKYTKDKNETALLVSASPRKENLLNSSIITSKDSTLFTKLASRNMRLIFKDLIAVWIKAKRPGNKIW